MSNIRDLQRLRVTRNSQNPESLFFNKLSNELPRTELLIRKSPTKQKAEPFTRSNFHKRGTSFGNYSDEKKSNVFQRPRISVYNFPPKFRPSFPLTEREIHTRIAIDNFVGPDSPLKKSAISPHKRELFSEKHFNICYVIGKGGFGKVWKVVHKKTGEVFAMKQMSKSKVIQKKSVGPIMGERDFLSKLNHNFLVNMSYAFQDRENLFLIMDYLNGGDMRYHLGNRRLFSEKETKFLIGNLLIGLEYLHKNKIIHRDLKPENLVLDQEGYMRITDLGISREVREDNQHETSGTPGYMAPEVMCSKEHGFTADYFALGVIAYEFMQGRRPYQGQNRREIKEQILMKQAAVRIDELPYRWSMHSIDFINKLLLRSPNQRLGARGIEEIQNHPWLADIDWSAMQAKKIKAPFVPLTIEEDYESYKGQISEDTIPSEEDNMLLLRRDEAQELFEGYYYEKGKNKKSLASDQTNHTDEGKKNK